MITQRLATFPADAWRKAPAMKSKRQDTGSVVTAEHRLDCQWTTGIAPVDSTPFTIITGGSVKNNLIIVENVAKNQILNSDSDKPIKDPLVTRSVFTMPTPSHSVSILGNKLLSCGNNGSVEIFKLSPSGFNKGQGVDSLGEMTLSDVKLDQFPISPPEKMIKSTRIRKAGFVPSGINTENTDTSVQQLIGIQMSELFYHDISLNKNISKESFGQSILTSLSFSQHFPYGQLFATGSNTSTLSLHDCRILEGGGKSSIWSVKDTHMGGITDVAFNTFIPYWIASSGEDGVVKMWDIRFLKGNAARIDAHYGSISSISWSNTHCEVISTASFDRSWRAWNIGYEDVTAKTPWKEFMVGCLGSEFKTFDDSTNRDLSIVGSKMLGDHNSFSSPLVSVAADPTHADTFLTVTALGVFSSHTIVSKVFEDLYPNHYENPYEKELENAIQSRHLSEAYETMIRLSRTEFAKDPSIACHEGDLIKLCSFGPAVSPESWDVGSLGVCDEEAVREDLKKYAHGLPPSFDRFPQWTTRTISDFIQIQFGLASLKYQITSEVAKGNWEILLQKEKEIINGIELDEEFIDTSTLALIVENLLVHKFLKGITFSLTVGQSLADIPRFKFESLADILSLLVFPTVYDSYSWIPEKDIDFRKLNATMRQEYVKKYLEHLEVEKRKNGLSRENTMGRNQARRKSSKITTKIRSRAPTMEMDSKSPSKHVKWIMSDDKKALPMISLEIKLLKLIELPPDDYYEEVIRIMQNVLTDSGVVGSKTKTGMIPFERTVSALTNRLYLAALLETKRYEEFFGVAIQLITSYHPLEFSVSLLRQLDRDGFTGAKSHISSMLATANTSLNATLTAQSTHAPLISSVKLLKDAAVMIVKITAHLMDVMEMLKTEKDKDLLESINKITTNLTALMMQVSAAILRAFEHFDRIAKTVCREHAHAVHDALRDAVRNMPLSSKKSRPTTAAEKASSGLTIQEEANVILEKLYKGHLKVEVGSFAK